MAGYRGAACEFAELGCYCEVLKSLIAKIYLVGDYSSSRLDVDALRAAKGYYGVGRGVNSRVLCVYKLCYVQRLNFYGDVAVLVGEGESYLISAYRGSYLLTAGVLL